MTLPTWPQPEFPVVVGLMHSIASLLLKTEYQKLINVIGKPQQNWFIDASSHLLCKCPVYDKW